MITLPGMCRSITHALALLLALGVALGACRKQATPAPSDETGAVPKPTELPPLEIQV